MQRLLNLRLLCFLNLRNDLDFLLRTTYLRLQVEPFDHVDLLEDGLFAR